MLKHRQPVKPTEKAVESSVQDCCVRILLLGNCQVGKTRLLLEYIDDRNKSSSDLNTSKGTGFDQKDVYIPTSLEVYQAKFLVNNTQYSLIITDMTGSHENSSLTYLRNSFYNLQAKIDVILLCFSLVDLISFADLKTKWMTEIKNNFKDVPIILVATKDDLKQRIKIEKKTKAAQISKLPKSRIGLQKPHLIKQASNTSTTTTITIQSTTSTVVPSTGVVSSSPSSPSSQLGAELILAGRTLLASTPPTAIFTPPPTPVVNYRPERISQSISLINRMSRDELVTSLVDEAAHDYENDSVFEDEQTEGDSKNNVLNLEAFKKALEKVQPPTNPALADTQRYYTVYEFLDDQVNGYDYEARVTSENTTINMGFLNETNTTLGTLSSDGGFPEEPRPKKYVSTRQIVKMRENIGGVEYFKTRADNPESISALMDKAISVGLLNNLRRRKAELKKQTCYEAPSMQDLSPFSDPGCKVSGQLKALEISANEPPVDLNELDKDFKIGSKEPDTKNDSIPLIDDGVDSPGAMSNDKACQTEAAAGMDEFLTDKTSRVKTGKQSKKDRILCCLKNTRSDTMTSISKHLK